ncbi:pyrroloquinoline quinone biosynthesis peptide chaperone PqqD [Polaromonas sp.]|uniref:pyrroloquinoline quinone biosynthesis peptide chaperone PqqD n=1 Tax=Polaromonas sp. TaxID=1869339 RepID=UPI0038621639
MHAASTNTSSEVALPERPKLSRLYRLQYEQVQTAWVLLYPEGMVQLNQSSAEILRRCNGERSIETIVADLEILFATQGIAPQVRAMLQESMRRGWIA